MAGIIPKPAPKVPLWQQIAFYSAIILLIAVIGSYFGLEYLEKKASEKIENLEVQIANVKTEEEMALRRELFRKEQNINDFIVILNKHEAHSALFLFLERICHPKVQFLGVGFSTEKTGPRVEIPANAESYEVVHQQLMILKDESLIKGFQLGGINIGKDGKIGFNLLLSLDPEIFKFK